MNKTVDPATQPGALLHLNGMQFLYYNGEWRAVFAGGDGTGDPPPNEGGDGGTGDPNDPPGGTGDETPGGEGLTQEQVNAIVAREKQKALRGKLDPKDLGFSSQKELQEFLDNARQKADEDKTEAEKALEQAKEEAAAKARQEILSVADQRILKAEFILAATKHGVSHPHDAFVIAQTMEDWSAEVNDKGVVSGLEDDFFEELKKQKPYLFGEPSNNEGPGDAGAGARGSGGGTGREDELRAKYPALR